MRLRSPRNPQSRSLAFSLSRFLSLIIYIPSRDSVCFDVLICCPVFLKRDPLFRYLLSGIRNLLAGCWDVGVTTHRWGGGSQVMGGSTPTPSHNKRFLLIVDPRAGGTSCVYIRLIATWYPATITDDERVRPAPAREPRWLDIRHLLEPNID
jgi:hypothetical protein